MTVTVTSFAALPKPPTAPLICFEPTMGGAPPSSFQSSAWMLQDADSAPIGNAITPMETSATESSNNNNNNNNNRVAVAVACVQCRSRHLKCDGAARCSRCVADDIPCSYIKSRRGWKGPRKSTRVQSTPVSATSIGMTLLLAKRYVESELCTHRTLKQRH